MELSSWSRYEVEEGHRSVSTTRGKDSNKVREEGETFRVRGRVRPGGGPGTPNLHPGTHLLSSKKKKTTETRKVSIQTFKI